MTGNARPSAAIWSLVAGDVISLTGNRIERLAVPWFVLATTGSPARAGLVAFASFVPLLLSAFIGGHVIDRVGARRTSIVADLASGMAIGTIPLLHRFELLGFWLLGALVFLGALLDAPGGTARRSLIPEAATAAGWRLATATSAQESAYRATQLFGGLAAAALIVGLGPSAALVVDAATFGVSAVLVGVGTHHLPVVIVPHQPFREALTAGLRFLRSDPLLRGVLVVFAWANAFENALVAVLLPVYAGTTVGGARTLGFPIAAMGAGALLGAIAYAMGGESLPARPLLVAGLLFAGPTKYLALALGAPLVVMIVVFFVAGAASGPINPLLSAVQLRRIPEQLRGRVLGLVTAVVMSVVPLALLAAGALAETVPLPTLFGVGAAVYTAVALLPLARSSWAELADS